MDGWVDGWVDDWVDGWMDGWMGFYVLFNREDYIKTCLLGQIKGCHTGTGVSVEKSICMIPSDWKRQQTMRGLQDLLPWFHPSKIFSLN